MVNISAGVRVVEKVVQNVNFYPCVIGLYKTEVIHGLGSWRNINPVECATNAGVDWFKNRRLPEPNGNIPPAKFEVLY